MNPKLFNSQKKHLPLYLLNFFIGFALFNHGISSWIVSRVSFTSFLTELNWLFIVFIVIAGLATNYLMLKDDKTKGKYISKGLIPFFVGAFLVSGVYIMRVGF